MGGFAMASSDKRFLFTDGLNTVEGARHPSVQPCLLFAIWLKRGPGTCLSLLKSYYSKCPSPIAPFKG